MIASLEGRLSGVAYVDSLAVVVVRFEDGRAYAVPVSDLEGLDDSAVTHTTLGSDGYAALVEQASGNRLEVPWDAVLYHAEPRYAFYRHRAMSAEQTADRGHIGERIRFERIGRHWTLADLSQRTGIKIPNLSRLEKGVHTPALPTLERVADAFGLPVAALVTAAADQSYPPRGSGKALNPGVSRTRS